MEARGSNSHLVLSGDLEASDDILSGKATVDLLELGEQAILTNLQLDVHERGLVVGRQRPAHANGAGSGVEYDRQQGRGWHSGALWHSGLLQDIRVSRTALGVLGGDFELVGSLRCQTGDDGSGICSNVVHVAGRVWVSHAVAGDGWPVVARPVPGKVEGSVVACRDAQGEWLGGDHILNGLRDGGRLENVVRVDLIVNHTHKWRE